MPRRQQVGILRRWGSKFLSFADLANRTIPLFVLHWYSRTDYPALLTHQIISDESDAYLHGLLLFFLHVIALTATVSTPCMLLGLHLVSFTLIQSHLPWLEESRQKLAALVAELEEDFGHPFDINGASDFRIKASYRVFLQVFVGFAVMRFPNFSLLYSSTAFSPIRVLTLGPVISTILLAIFPGDYLASCLSVLLAACTGILLYDSFATKEALGILMFTFRQDTTIYYAHLRRSCARLERWKVTPIFILFFIFRMIETVVRIVAEEPPVPTALTWFTLGEELLRRSCDSTVSLMGLACVSITGVKYVMRGVRDVLRLEGAGEDLKDEFFFLCFSLAVFSEAPLSDQRAGLACLIRFLKFYVLSWIICIIQSIDYQLWSLRELPNIPRGHALRIFLAASFVQISALLVVLHHQTASIMTFVNVSVFLTEVLIKFCAYFYVGVSIIFDGDLAPFWEDCERFQYTVRKVIHMMFTFNCLMAPCLLDPEVFFGLDLRVFTEGNVEAQIEMCKTRRMQRRKEAALAIEFRGATSHELASENHMCSICYEKMESAAVTECSHIFHRDCLRTWIQLHISCPMCRMPLDGERQID